LANIWKIGDGGATFVGEDRIERLGQLERWLADDITPLDAGLLVVGRQIHMGFGRIIDLVAVDASGRLTAISIGERVVTAATVMRVIECCGWLASLSSATMEAMIEEYFGERDLVFKDVFEAKFASSLPTPLFRGAPRMLLIGPVAPDAQRVISCLSSLYGQDVRTMLARSFIDEGSRYLEIEEQGSEATRRSTSRVSHTGASCGIARPS
jgi:hypothetical protein